MADQACASGDQRNNLPSKTHPSSSLSTSSSSLNISKTSGKCPQTHFLLCALTVAQVGLLSLFLVWTIKTCFTRYQRVFIVYPVDSRHSAVSNQEIITGDHHHGNQNHFMSHLLKDIPFEGEIISNNATKQINYFQNRKQNFSIVGITRSDLLVFTLNWLESITRLNLNYDVTLIVQDQPTYDILSRKNKKIFSWRFITTRLKSASDMGQNGTALHSSLSTGDCDVILDVVRSGIDVLWTNTDSVWLKDPMPLIWNKYNECDLWINRHGDNQTDRSSFMFLKYSPIMISFVKALKLRIEKFIMNSKAIQSLDVDYVSLKFASHIGMHRLSRKFNLHLCPLDETEFPSERHVFEESGWFALNKGRISVVRTGAIQDLGRKKDLLFKKDLWYLRTHSQ